MAQEQGPFAREGDEAHDHGHGANRQDPGLDDRLRHLRLGVHQGPVPGLGRPARRMPRRAHGALGRFLDADAIRGPLRHRADIQHFSSRDVLVARSRRRSRTAGGRPKQTGGAAAIRCWRTADHIRPAAPHVGARLLLPPFSAPAVAKWSQRRASCATRSSMTSSTTVGRTALSTTRSRSRRASSPPCSASRRRSGHVHGVGARLPRTGPDEHRPPERGAKHLHLPLGAHPGAQGAPRDDLITYLLTPRSTASRCRSRTCSGRAS